MFHSTKSLYPKNIKGKYNFSMKKLRFSLPISLRVHEMDIFFGILHFTDSHKYTFPNNHLKINS